MNIEECMKLYAHEPKGVPTHDVLLSRYKVWDSVPPTYNVNKKKNIILNNGSYESIFITPPSLVISANINGSGVNLKGRQQHVLTLSKDPLPKWNLSCESLPYNAKHSSFYKDLEQVVHQCLRIAFDDAELFKEATDYAWERVNMDAENPDKMAFDIFVSNAILPFTETTWTIRKNHCTKRGQKMFVPIMDIASIEHTGNFNIEKGAIVSSSIRLWPYHLDKYTYGVSASFGDPGIRVFHKGGLVTPRRNWKTIHHHIVEYDNTYLYDIRGSFFRIKTPLCTVISQQNNEAIISIHKEGKELWLQALQTLEETIKNHMKVEHFVSCLNVLEKTFTLRIQSYNGITNVNEKYIFVLKNALYKNENGNGMLWTIDRATKINV